MEDHDGQTPPPVLSDRQAWQWAMGCHLASFASFLGVPFGGIIGPLVVWLMKRQEHPFIDSHGREAVNFQISIVIYVLVCIPLIFVLIGIPLLIALGVFDLVMTIIAAVKAAGGERFHYPLTIRFLN